MTSSDGRKIESLTLTAPGTNGLAFGAGKFVAINPDGIFTSPDAQQWDAVSGAPQDELRGLLWAGDTFILTGKVGTYASPDGLVWKPYGGPPRGNIIYGDKQGFVSTGWPGHMFFSPDAQTWTTSGQPLPGLGINKVVFGAP